MTAFEIGGKILHSYKIDRMASGADREGEVSKCVRPSPLGPKNQESLINKKW